MTTKLGNPRLRWLGDTQNDLRELKEIRCGKMANNRKKGSDKVIKETKISRGR
jgi:hypothetical protein